MPYVCARVHACALLHVVCVLSVHMCRGQGSMSGTVLCPSPPPSSEMGSLIETGSRLAASKSPRFLSLTLPGSVSCKWLHQAYSEVLRVQTQTLTLVHRHFTHCITSSVPPCNSPDEIWVNRAEHTCLLSTYYVQGTGLHSKHVDVNTPDIMVPSPTECMIWTRGHTLNKQFSKCLAAPV